MFNALQYLSNVPEIIYYICFSIKIDVPEMGSHTTQAPKSGASPVCYVILRFCEPYDTA